MNVRTEFYDRLISKIRGIYGEGFVPLHRPVFTGNEKKYLTDVIDSNFVSSVGQMVTDFEDAVADFTGAKYAIATVNGTCAIHIALLLAGVSKNDEVITQSLTFVATCNAIANAGAHPVFVDVDLDTMGLSPKALQIFISKNYIRGARGLMNKNTGRRLAACMPMHTFGNPMRINELEDFCDKIDLPVVEDAAEALGSYVGTDHVGTIGKIGIFSFNGNKIITTGGGGMIVTNDEYLAKRAKYLTTTAKVPHPFEFYHDEVGYNYRMPNLNAALGVSQMEVLPEMLKKKKNVRDEYESFFKLENAQFVTSIKGSLSNNWLNAITFSSIEERNEFLKYTNDQGVMTRPIWKLMNTLPMYQNCETGDLKNSIWLESRIVNIPSSVP